MNKKKVNQTADDVVTINGSIMNREARRVATAVNYNAQILKDALNRIAELEKIIKLKTESDEIKMGIEEARKYIKSKMCDDCGIYLGGGKCSEKCKAIKALEALEKEPSREIKEIEEVMNCDADAETKCKMISNILTAKPHYFDDSQGSEEWDNNGKSRSNLPIS